MPSSQHILMGRYAHNSLPAWEQDFWQSQREQIAEHCLIPDRYYTNKAEYARYCVMPNGVTMPHAPTDAKWTMPPFVHEHCTASHHYVIEYYLQRLVQTISAGDTDGSALFAGVFAHFLQDSSQPAHLMHNDWLYSLVPRPPGQYRHLHRDLDEADPDEEALAEVKPRLLGTTVAEAAFQLRAAYEKMIHAALAQLVPMVSAAYAEDGTAMNQAIKNSYTTATELTASAWHTAHCIAARRFDSGERRELEVVRLNRVPYSRGFAIDPYGFRPLMDFACDGRGNTVPLTLRLGSTDADVTEQAFADGIAMAWGNVQYDIPSSVYAEFRAKIGLLSSVSDRAKAVFKVVLGGGPVVYEEASATISDYGGEVVFDSGVMTGTDTARKIAVPLGAAAGITLVAECPEEPTHALWVEPVLVKKG